MGESLYRTDHRKGDTMRGTRKVTEQDILGDSVEEQITDSDLKKEVKQISNPYRYKSDFKHYQGESAILPKQKFNKKGQPEVETDQQLIDRSMFFSNFVNGKYKIIMVYKGRNDVVKRRLFDLFTKKNKLKYNFFKQKGIVF